MDDSSIGEILRNKTVESPIKEKIKQSNEKLEQYFFINEQALLQKVDFTKKQVDTKLGELKILQSFENPIMKILNKCVEDYEKDLLNSKLTNQQVFFNSEGHDTIKNNVSYTF